MVAGWPSQSCMVRYQQEIISDMGQMYKGSCVYVCGHARTCVCACMLVHVLAYVYIIGH
jgi:hypothetical protein